jgi:Ca2+-binding RTX toxin-like protein
MPTITGTEDADALAGTPEDDIIVAQGGADRIEDLEGNDIIQPGGGDDLVIDPDHVGVHGGSGLDTAVLGRNSSGVEIVVYDLTPWSMPDARGGVFSTDRLSSIELIFGRDIDEVMQTSGMIRIGPAGQPDETYATLSFKGSSISS